MNEGSEIVMGEFPIVTSLVMGNEHLRLFVTERRMIFAFVGQRGGAAYAASTFLGMLGGAVEDLLKSGKESLDREKLAKLVPDQILVANKDNFAVNYDEVVHVDLLETPRFTMITMVTRDEKMEFRTSRKFSSVCDLLGPRMAGKVQAIGLHG